MIIGSRIKYELGTIIQCCGPEGRIKTGLIPGLIIAHATKEQYLENMKGFESNIPRNDVLDEAYFYEVSVD